MRLLAGAGRVEDALGVAARLRRRDEQVLGRDVLVLEALGLVLGPLDELAGARVERELAARDPGTPAEHGAQVDAHPAGSAPSGGG